MLALLALTALSAAPPHPTVESAVAELNRLVEFEDVALSPDGERVAWVEAAPTPAGPSGRLRILRLVARSGGTPVRITAARDGADHEEDEPVFSPDGKWLAFLSDAEQSGQPQLYVLEVATGAVRKLTQASGHLERPRWSPDGKRLAVLYLEGAADALGPLGPSARETGVIGSVVREQRIALVPAEGGRLAPVSPDDLFVYEYAWSPDGTGFAATGAHGSGDDNWWSAELYLIPSSGGAVRVLHHPALQICEPTWSPDGTRVAFIEGLMSDAGANGGDVLVIQATGGKAQNVTPGMAASAAQLSWTRGAGLVAAAVIGGDSAFLRVDPDRPGIPGVLWRGPEHLTARHGTSAAFSADGATVAVARETGLEPPEVWVGPVGRWTQLSRANAALKSPAARVERLGWKSGRWGVQGWLYLPPEETWPGKRPLVVTVHGGPAGVAKNTFQPKLLVLVSQGFAVLAPNPRGSFGQGEAFTRANVKDFGHGDLQDILAGVDAAVRSGRVDGTRVGIRGHSYGGYMAMFAVTQTRRFKAAMASAGIANWLSYYGQNKIDQWMLPYFGATVYADPAVYARSSPMQFITRVKTPTLVLVGERDAECPAPQSYEFWHALKTLDVPTELVVYADEGHRFRDPAHVLDAMQREVGWFDRYLGSPRQSAPR
ncbi:MAG TPA: S9 family peptidase [Myxococcaceae bacterium]|nr:S9 family peptidase [Myxococcaceae bacterium]